MCDGGTDWWATTLGTGGGVLGAAVIAAIGWKMKRTRTRRALARVLFFDAKRVRIDWADAKESGRAVAAPESYLSAWRSVQDRAVDLLPDVILRRLFELQWIIYREGTSYTSTGVGIKDAWAIAARAERDLGKIAGEAFDAGTEAKLAEIEAELHGNKP